MKINFLEIAKREIDEAFEFYNYTDPGLGDLFLRDILDALDRIAAFQKAWHPCSAPSLIRLP